MSLIRPWLLILVSCVAGLYTLAHLMSVEYPDELQDSVEIESLPLLFGDSGCLDRWEMEDFHGQLGCIERLQRHLSEFGRQDCGEPRALVSIKAFADRGYGCCYDRAHAFASLLSLKGVGFRNVYMYSSRLWGGLDVVLSVGLPSHAVIEVHTSRGWMGVDSMKPYILVGQNDRGNLTPLTFVQARDVGSLARGKWGEHMASLGFDVRPNKSPMVIYGLLSRHGFAFAPLVPLPDLALDQLRYNFGL